VIVKRNEKSKLMGQNHVTFIIRKKMSFCPVILHDIKIFQAEDAKYLGLKSETKLKKAYIQQAKTTMDIN